MSRLASVVAVTALLAFATGCDKKPETTTGSDTTTTATVVTTPGMAAPGTKAAASDEPVEQDFEDEAEASITAANLEAEIVKMEAELK